MHTGIVFKMLTANWLFWELSRSITESISRSVSLLDIDIKDPVEIHVDAEKIKKYKPGSKCIVTGEIRDKNLSLANEKIILSPQSAQDILDKLQRYIQKEGAV